MSKPASEKSDKNQQPNITIKKVKKIVGGHHGGAWKVAYADFVTAMMAFFLLMWLITALKPQTKAVIASYFREGKEIVLERGGPPSPDVDRPPAADNEPINTGEGFSDPNIEEAVNEAKEIQADLNEVIEEKFADLKDQILVELVDGNVRIEIVDKAQNPLFAVGSSALNENAIKIVEELAKVIVAVPNKVIIEGHTDSLNYKGSNYTNWELSTERASVARQILERKGMDENRIAMVAGYASTSPIMKHDPENAKNRRISIVILSHKINLQHLYE